MKKILALALSAALSVSLLCACGSSPNEADANVTLRVGASITPHAEILKQCVDTLAAQGITLEVVEYTDYVQPNTAVQEGDLTANYFQHINYLNWFNEEYDTTLVSVGFVHYEPFGIYAGQKSSLSELTAGDSIAIPNDGSNETRALLLLQQEGIITLNEGITAASNATVKDIASYAVDVEILEMEAAQLTKALPDVAVAVINGNFALQGGLNAGADAIAIEDPNGESAQEYGNILVVKEGNENSEAVLALLEALHSEATRTFIEETYNGAVVPIF